MRADAVGDAVHPRPLAEINRQAAGALQRPRVELEPARVTCARQTAVGDDYVRGSAGVRNRRPAYPIARARCQQPPLGLVLPKQRDTGIVRAVAGWLAFEEVGIAIEPRCFGEETPDIIAGAVAQKQRCPVLDDGEMAAIAGHQQIGRRRSRRRHSSDRHGQEAQEPQACVP